MSNNKNQSRRQYLVLPPIYQRAGWHVDALNDPWQQIWKTINLWMSKVMGHKKSMWGGSIGIIASKKSIWGWCHYTVTSPMVSSRIGEIYWKNNQPVGSSTTSHHPSYCINQWAKSVKNLASSVLRMVHHFPCVVCVLARQWWHSQHLI